MCGRLYSGVVAFVGALAWMLEGLSTQWQSRMHGVREIASSVPDIIKKNSGRREPTADALESSCQSRGWETNQRSDSVSRSFLCPDISHVKTPLGGLAAGVSKNWTQL